MCVWYARSHSSTQMYAFLHHVQSTTGVSRRTRAHVPTRARNLKHGNPRAPSTHARKLLRPGTWVFKKAQSRCRASRALASTGVPRLHLPRGPPVRVAFEGGAPQTFRISLPKPCKPFGAQPRRISGSWGQCIQTTGLSPPLLLQPPGWLRR